MRYNHPNIQTKGGIVTVGDVYLFEEKDQICEVNVIAQWTSKQGAQFLRLQVVHSENPSMPEGGIFDAMLGPPDTIGATHWKLRERRALV